jgi:hypothetical protein
MTVERSLGERRANPFSRELARANSSRAVFRGKKLVRTPLGEPATPLQEFVHDSFRALVLNPAFSCVGAKSAVRRGSYNFGLYAEMDSLEGVMNFSPYTIASGHGYSKTIPQ